MSVDSHAARAYLHRPRTLEELRDAPQRVAQEDGYSDYGIVATLGMAVERVRRLIGHCGDCE